MAELCALTIGSTIIFLTFPTFLWTAGPHTSHVSRFVVSYLAVVPFAALLLAIRRRRLRAAELAAAVLIVWAVKMLITVGLYHGLAGRARPRLEPALVERRPPVAADRRYTPIEAFSGRRISGSVVTPDGTALVGALVYLKGLHQGKPTVAGATSAVVFDGAYFKPFLSATTAGSHLAISNNSNAPVVVTGRIDGRSVFNVPIIGGSSRRIRLTKQGRLKLSPRSGTATETAWVQVLAHPYFAVTGTDGTFAFENAPNDALTLTTIYVGGDGALQINRREVSEGSLDIGLSTVFEIDRGANS